MSAARGRRSVVPGLNRAGSEVDRRQRTLGSSDGTVVRGLGGKLGMQRWLSVSTEELRWLRRGRAASACGSPVQRMLRIPLVHCRSPKSGSGWLLEGSRRGTRPVCGSGRVRRSGADPGCKGAAGRSGQRSREQREEEGEGADGRAQGISGRCGAEGGRAGPRA
jgi:hypothetical protein